MATLPQIASDPAIKWCSHHKCTHPIEDFGRNGLKKRSVCKNGLKEQYDPIKGKAYREANKNNYRVANKKWHEKNREYRAKKDKEKREANIILYRKKALERQKANPEKVVAAVRRRYASKIQAIPKWADLEKIKKIYSDCAFISKSTGIPHHVDHIIPLKGKKVCGLHVENNLQIIPAQENMLKSNKFIGESNG